MRRLAKVAATGVAAASVGVFLALTPFGTALEDRLGLSWLFWLRGPVAAPDDVVVISLDRESGERLGYPDRLREWPRSVYARLVERLAEAGASVVVLDVVFDQERDEDQDAALARAINRARRVVLLEKLDRIRREMRGHGASFMVTTERVIQPIEPLAKAAAGLAPFPLPAGDRVSHFWTFKVVAPGRPTLPVVALQQVALSDSAAWLSLLRRSRLLGTTVRDGAEGALAALRPEQLSTMLRQAFHNDPTAAERLFQQLQAAGLDDREQALLEAVIRTHAGPDHHYLNFYGPPGHLRTIPVHELMAGGRQGRAHLDLTGRAVFVGQSERANLHADRFHTVFSGPDGVALSGVEIAATAYANLLEGDLLEPAGVVPSVAALTAFGMAVGLAAALMPSVFALPACLLIGLAYVIGVELSFSDAHRSFPIAIPVLVQLPFGLFLGLVVQHRAAQQARRNLSRSIRYYLPEKVVAGLAQAPLQPEASSELVYAACMVADVEGFTSFAEDMSPRELNALLNRYFATLFAAVERHGGVITDVVGDGITAVWSAPVPEVGPRIRACRAALEMERVVLDFNREYGAPAMPLRIGMHAGMVVLGNVGGSGHFAYSVIGDSVNTAARIESLNKQLGTRVLATGTVASDLPDLVLRPLGRFQLFGKRQALSIFELMGPVGETNDPSMLATFAEALRDFTSQRWAEAATKFAAILAERPTDGPAKFYLARCRRYQDERPLPPDPTVIHLHHK